MNDKRFTELINLYLDHEISDGEMTMLEEETARNPARRQIFNEYVRLQEATSQLVGRHGTRLVESVDFKKYHMIARQSGWSLRRAVFVSSGALAAACLTVVAAVRVFQGGSMDIQPDPVFSVGELTAAVEVFRPTDAQTLRSFSVRPPVSGDTRMQVHAAKASPPVRRVDLFELARGTAEMSGIQVNLTADEMRTDSQTRVFRSSPVFQSAPEFASFEFQR